MIGLNKMFNKLSWILIEHKIRYYLLNKPSIGDAQYDELEAVFFKLAKRLKKESSVTLKPGIDVDNWAVKAAYSKITGQYSKIIEGIRYEI